MVVRFLLIFSVAEVALAAPAVVRQRHLDLAKAASEKRGPGSDNGATGDDLPPESSSRMPPQVHEPGTWEWWFDNASMGPPPGSPEGSVDGEKDTSRLLPSDVPSSSSVAEDRITTQASGASGSDNGATGDLPPESSSRMPPHVHEPDTWAWWFDNAVMGPLPGGPEPSLKSSNINPPSPPNPPKPPPPDIPAWLGHLDDAHTLPSGSESPPEWPTSPNPPPPPPPQGPAPESLGAPKGFISDSLKHKLLVSSGVAGILVSAAAFAYGVHLWTKHPYVSPSLLSPADI